MNEWISVDERLPNIAEGDELHCFIVKRNRDSGKTFVMDAYWLNKPIPSDITDDDDMPDYVLRDHDGDFVSMIGWAERAAHQDFDGYYISIDNNYCDVIAWQPVIYPAFS